MMKGKGVPAIELGTPPTPSNPRPSNQIVKKYEDKTIIITPPPTETVLAEYEQAIATDPSDSGLRLEYGHALKKTGNLAASMEQFSIAVQLAPDSEYAHASLAYLLSEQGEHERAIAEYEESLKLVISENAFNRGQTEVLARWGLANALYAAGRATAACAQLDVAIEMERAVVAQGYGSKQLLRQMRNDRKTHV